MRIFIAGPYGDHNPKEVIAENVRRADEAGRTVARQGHTPFIPHKMTWGWEDDPMLKHEDFIRIDNEWLMLCDAILLLPNWEQSGGSIAEKALAEQYGKEVFHYADWPQ